MIYTFIVIFIAFAAIGLCAYSDYKNGYLTPYKK